VIAAVVLDSGPLSLATNPKDDADTRECAQWLQELSDAEVPVYIPEIVDYELRRELLRANKVKGLRRLDGFIGAEP
jgi:predicted nucleic acid-binding protein